jgi:glycosyltransferase involved in cell wall biosynthesis
MITKKIHYKFSLIIPCFNEAKSLPILVQKCVDLNKIQRVEIVLVDNGSNDDTEKIFNKYNKKYSFIKIVKVKNNKGYGYGILTGLNSSSGDIIGWTHADLQCNPFDVINAIKLFEKHGSNIFVKGKRFGRPFGDRLFTFFMSMFETILLRKLMSDINAQPTLFPRTFYEKWKNPPHDFALDLYAYHLAIKYNVKIHKFPVFFKNRTYGQSHWNISFSEKYKFIKRTISFSINLIK